jgi:hypothetical protein
MSPLSEAQVRRSFVNLTAGEAKRANLPNDLATRPWDRLDYLGWRDPKSPQRAYLVVERAAGICGVGLRRSTQPTGPRRTMCSLCLTVGDVALMVAPRAGRSGQAGNSVGTYICADLVCSLYARNLLRAHDAVAHETLGIEQKVARLRANLDAFVDRVVGA